MAGYLGLYSGSLTIDGAYLSTPAGGGGGNELQLNGQTLQLNAEDLTLGA